MRSRLTGQSEWVPGAHREFYFRLNDQNQMQFLVSGKDESGKIVDVPRIPASFEYVLKRRIKSQKDVREEWYSGFLTGDGSVAGVNGDNLIVLDAQAVREITPASELFQGALVIPVEVWRELRSRKENVVYFTADEVKEAEGKFMLKRIFSGLGFSA